MQAVVQELRGEAIDIIPFSPDPTHFFIDAIAPANVTKCILDTENRSIDLIVPDNQLSKAIGRHGQNVRLASQLTQWKIDIYSESKHNEINDLATKELSRIPLLDDEDILILIRHKYLTLTDVYDATEEDIMDLLGFTEEEAEEVIQAADQAIVELQEEERRLREQTINIPQAE